jgi:hypothetical protein
MKSEESKPKKPSKKHYVDPVRFKDLILEYYDDDEFSEELGEMINKISEHVAYMPNFMNYCVDGDTQALSRDGWKSYDELLDTDVILSYDVSDGTLKWSDISDIFINDFYCNKMHTLRVDGLNALVTVGHRFVTKDNGLQKIEDIDINDKIILMGSELEDELKVESDKANPISDHFLDLLTLVLTSNSFKSKISKRRIDISQMDEKDNFKMLQLLSINNARYKEYRSPEDEVKWVIRGTLAKLICKYAKNGILNPEFINRLNAKQRIKLIKSMVVSCGITNPYETYDGKSDYWTYISRNNKNIDSFLMLCTLSGLKTNTHTVTVFGGKVCHVVEIYPNSINICKFSDIEVNGELPNGELKPIHFNSGAIWCPKTNYGTFVCRRHGNIYVTGNTYRDEMISDSNFKMIKALNQRKYDPTKGNPFAYFTKICCRSFINVIKKEKRVSDTVSRYQMEIYDELALKGLSLNQHDNQHGDDIDE